MSMNAENGTDANSIISTVMTDDMVSRLRTAFEHYPQRALVLKWLVDEWLNYADLKWKFAEGPQDDHNNDMRDHGFHKGTGFWFRQVTQYFSRASLFGIGEPESPAPLKGRQALFKGLVTLFDCCACTILVHGNPPDPGHTSGEVHPWVH